MSNTRPAKSGKGKIVDDIDEQKHDRRMLSKPGCGVGRFLFIKNCRQGIRVRTSSSHAPASASLGARQSPRGLSEPPDPTFGPLGRHDRLNWLSWKNRWTKISSHFLIVAKPYSRCLSAAK